MRTVCFGLAVMVFMGLFSGAASADTFGPDAFGYVADTDAAFSWIDATDGTSAGLVGDDEESGSLPIGFTFNFYGTEYTDFYVTTNGLVHFGAFDGGRPYNYIFQLGALTNAIFAYAGDRGVYDAQGGLFFL